MNMINVPAVTMSSREISDLTGKRHDHVKRDIEKLLSDLGEDIPKFGAIYLDSMNREQTEYLLDRDHTENLLLGYSPMLRRAVLARMREMEAMLMDRHAGLPDFGNPVAAARAWADEREARQIAERTKAQIGSRREATAMNAASQAVKKLKKLEIELDRSLSCATVKRMEDYYGKAFPWRPLKKAAEAMGAPSENVADANYGTVKAYRAEVWREVYGVEIPPPE